MWAGWGAYSSGGALSLWVYFVQKYLSLILEGKEISKCSSGRFIWYCYFSLTYHAIKQVLASYLALPFSFPLPHFLILQFSRCRKWLFKKRLALSSDLTYRQWWWCGLFCTDLGVPPYQAARPAVRLPVSRVVQEEDRDLQLPARPPASVFRDLGQVLEPPAVLQIAIVSRRL